MIELHRKLYSVMWRRTMGWPLQGAQRPCGYATSVHYVSWGLTTFRRLNIDLWCPEIPVVIYFCTKLKLLLWLQTEQSRKWNGEMKWTRWSRFTLLLVSLYFIQKLFLSNRTVIFHICVICSKKKYSFDLDFFLNDLHKFSNTIPSAGPKNSSRSKTLVVISSWHFFHGD